MSTFAIEELIATKIRALFQRRKGRDLVDLWLAVADFTGDLDQLVNAGPEGYTIAAAAQIARQVIRAVD